MIEEPVLQLSPPQYTYFNFIKHAIGNDPCVDVSEIEETPEGYLIPILVKDEERARDLATILVLHQEIGNFHVYLKILYNNQPVVPRTDFETIDDIVEIFSQGLCSNHFFVDVVAKEIFPGFLSIFPVFKKCVIQFFNDDLSDLYANFNSVAADVFRSVLKTSINDIIINPSTEKRT